MSNMTEKSRQQMEATLADVRKKALRMLIACDELEEGSINIKAWEKRIIKKVTTDNKD